MKRINVFEESQKGVPKILLENPVTEKGEMSKRALKALHVKSFGKKARKNVLETFKAYQEKESEWLEKDAFSKEEIQEKKNEAVKRTVFGVLRSDFLEDKKTSYEEEEEGEKMCCLSSTSAKEPDPEHAVLEFVPLPCTEVMELLSRYGCQHDFLELSPRDVKKLGGAK